MKCTTALQATTVSEPMDLRAIIKVLPHPTHAQVANLDTEPGDKPDVEYRGLLFFSGEAWEHHDNEDYGVDDGYFELYFKKPSFWDSDDYYTIVWEVGENGIEETFDEEALESPMTTPPTSPIFNTATMFTLEQIQSLYIANPSPTSSEAESVTVKTASSRSPARSASLPPSPAIAYMRLSWPSSREWQALLTCEVFAPRGEPTNFRVRRLSHNFNGNHEASEVYFQNPERDDEIIWDDNANPLIIGHICWNSDPLDFVKIYGKRVIKVSKALSSNFPSRDSHPL